MEGEAGNQHDRARKNKKPRRFAAGSGGHFKFRTEMRGSPNHKAIDLSTARRVIAKETRHIRAIYLEIPVVVRREAPRRKRLRESPHIRGVHFAAVVLVAADHPGEVLLRRPIALWVLLGENGGDQTGTRREASHGAITK